MRPNILFLFTDQQHWQAVGYRDPSFTTPHLDALAARSTVFNRAFCTTPQCSPSRSSIMTGFYPSKTGVRGNVGALGGDPLNQPTIGQMLQDAGYHTGYFGKWHLGDKAVATAGWDDHDIDDSQPHNDVEATRRAIAFLKNAPADKPFALFVAINNPHDVYHVGGLIGKGLRAPQTDAPQTLPRSWYEQDFSTVPTAHAQFMTEDQGKFIVNFEEEGPWKLYREVYREKTRLADQHFGDVLAALQATGRAGDTAIIATSDHGDMDCQHRLVFKGPFMYDHMLRIPLSIQLPGQTERRDVDWPTVNVDLAPTFAALAGVALDCDGASLLPVLETGQGAPRGAVFAQYHSKQLWGNPIRTVITDRYKYSRYVRGPEELYDLQSDPDELHNLADDPQFASAKTDLAAQLDAWIEANGDNFHDLYPTDRQGAVIQVGA